MAAPSLSKTGTAATIRAKRRAPQPFARTGAPRDGYNYFDLLLQIGRAAELNGFDGLWIPESPSGEAPLIVAGSLAREVPRLKLVPTLRAPLMSAVYATKIANSFQRLTGGRLGWNLEHPRGHRGSPLARAPLQRERTGRSHLRVPGRGEGLLESGTLHLRG